MDLFLTNDFSKIQARFKVQMQLTSKDAKEVIKQRLLAKSRDALPALDVSCILTLNRAWILEKSLADLSVIWPRAAMPSPPWTQCTPGTRPTSRCSSTSPIARCAT